MSNDAVAELLALNEPDERLVGRACLIGRSATIVALLLMLTTPIGWIIQRPILRPELPSLTGAHVFGTVLLHGVVIATLVLFYGVPARMSRLVWAIAVVVNGIVLIEYLTPQELPFAQYIRFIDPVDNSSKIAPNSAFCIWLLALAGWMVTSSREAIIRTGQALCLLAALVAALAVIGHAYTIEEFYGLETYSELSVPGALSYILLAIGMLLIRPAKGMTRIVVTRGAAGLMTRRLYAPVILLPPILGFLSLVSVEIWRWYNLPFGLALFAVSSILLLTSVVAMTSVQIEAVDLSRAKAEQELGHTITALEGSRAQLRTLSAHIQAVQEDERLRIAREVHDELGQALTALKMDVSLLKNQGPNGNAHQPEEKSLAFEQRTSSILSLVNSTIKTVQRISAELRPSLLDDLGLAAAIEWQARQFEQRSGIEVTVDVEDIEIDRTIALAVFRIYQETLTNIARHSQASQVSVLLHATDNEILLQVRDEGIGFDTNEKRATPSLGLIGMRERAQLVSGELSIDSSPGNGTTVELRVPLDQTAVNSALQRAPALL